MNYFCFLCTKRFVQLSYVIYHLRNVHFLFESKDITLKCVISNKCERKFSTYSGLRRHALTCRTENANDDPDVGVSQSVSEEHFQIPEIEKNGNKITCNEVNIKLVESVGTSIKRIIQDFSNAIAPMSLTENDVNIIHSKLKDVLKDAFLLHEEYIKHFTDIGQIFHENSTKFLGSIIEEIDSCSSKYKRKKILNSDTFYVEPIPKSLGGRWDKVFNSKMNCYNDIYRQCTFQFVPITQTLKVIFANESFQSHIFKKSHECSTDIIKNYCCTQSFKSNGLFQKEENALQIQLFYDDFESVNPLGSKTTIHKVGAIYFTIRNMPSEYNSHLNNIYLVSLFFVNDLKNTNVTFNSVLKPIVDDIKILETEGIDVAGINVKGTLVNMCHDNLGGNIALGFVESFRANFFCRICTMPKKETESSIRESSYFLRTSSSYDALFQTNKEEVYTDYNESKGIKRYCILNDLKYFHVIESNSLDLMHDVLEGAIPFILKYFFKNVIEMKIFTIEDINNRIKSFHFSFLYKKNLPPHISIEKGNTSIGLTASQNLCLFLHFPFIFYDIMKKVSKLWEGVLMLLKTINILFSTEINGGSLQNLQNFIAYHLKIILEHYKRSLLPKHHLLTHYPSFIRRMGLPTQIWSMRFESKHRFFKKQASIKNNFVNICQTLSLAHQKIMAKSVKEASFEKDFSFGKIKKLSTTCTDQVVKNYFSGKSDINSVNWVSFTYGFYYRPGYIITIKKNSEASEFGLIKSIYLYQNEFHFHITHYESIFFENDLNALNLKEMENSSIICYNDLELKKPKAMYTINKKMYVLIEAISD